MGIAAINQWRAHEAYKEARANYIPQLTIGSGLGYSYGFPLTLEGSAPSVVNFNSSSVAVQSFAEGVSCKAAKIDWKATSLDIQDKRDAVILDTALTYAHLDQLTAKIAALTEAQTAAEKAQFVSEQRLKEGVDSKLEVTKSQLLTARIRLRIAEAQGQADVLREHLAICWECLPIPSPSIQAPSRRCPLISQDDDLPARAVANSLRGEAGGAESCFRAKRELRVSTRPRVHAHHRPGFAIRLPCQVQQLRFVLPALHRQQL